MTPNSCLARNIRKRLTEVETEILVQENIGNKIKDKVCNMKDPWKKINCERENCIPCLDKKYGECWSVGCTYKIECKKCKDRNRSEVYDGESARGMYSRIREHANGFLLCTKDSVLHHHHQDQHRETVMDLVDWEWTTMGGHGTPLERQSAEGVNIQEELRKQKQIGRKVQLLNSRNDFNQPGIIHTSSQPISQQLK